MKIVSFDIGIYNLAYAHLDVPSVDANKSIDLSLQTKIVDWGILCLNEKTTAKSNYDFGAISKTLIAMLYEKFSEDSFDVVLIENQPCMKNPTMKSIQMIVYGFFLMKAYQESADIDIKLVSASNKMKVKYQGDVSHIKSNVKYTQNKQKVIAHVKRYLELTKDINSEWTDKFLEEKKKDDWSDSYAQAIHFIEHAVNLMK